MFFFRRLYKNFLYYGLEILVEEYSSIVVQQFVNDFMVEMVSKLLDELVKLKCVEVYLNGDVDLIFFGKIMSYYYFFYKIICYFVKYVKF